MCGIAGVIGGDLNRTKESRSEHAVDDTLWVSKQTENGAVCGVAAIGSDGMRRPRSHE